MTTFNFHQPYNANERISFTHILSMNSTVVNDATYYRSRTPNALAFDSFIYLNSGFYLHQSVRATQT
ncbi:hypothetical protein F383_11098 [Gossypium arboreum]|uniref:Uncharacterized protein n=1 Tax=Gossypium arboreum TaxID=29729 RepID=A0A0B0NGV4_GOSAR|nr:hypothetical protein F383_11098 [Gossypium arboreum]